MIRTVPIPKTASRMGCAPGGGCCDECGGHNLAGTHRNVFPAGAARRNPSLHRALGDVECDVDGNCYTDGVMSSQNVNGVIQMVGNSLTPTDTVAGPLFVNAAGATSYTPPTSSTNTWLILGAGLIAALFLESLTRSSRR